MDRRLHIYYRHVHSSADAISRDPNKQRPDWFNYEGCFRNLLASIHGDPMGNRVKIMIMFDGQRKELVDDFISGYYANPDLGLSLQMMEAGSDGNSAMITFHCVHHSDLRPGDSFYILENDYMHAPGWVSKVFELYDSGFNVDYVSLYDHKDNYFLPMYAGLSAYLFSTPSHHWRTTPSTCGSFLCEISIYRTDYDIFLRAIKDYFLFDALIKERKRVLLTPIPGLATHCMEGYLSPTINWTQYVV